MNPADFRLSETCHTSHAALGAHRHRCGYIALPLDGTYDEQSVDGVFNCRSGVAVLHGDWHEHADNFGAGGGFVMNIALPEGLVGARSGSALIAIDTNAIERLARRNPREAAFAVLEEHRATRARKGTANEWTQTAATAMREAPQVKIADLAALLGVSREHASRTLKRRLGASPTTLRGEFRFRLAADLLASGAKPVHVAASAGYADQSHMARDIKARAGRTPKTYRRA
ncbi:MAG: helix-turn-helix transcriptional regulator [Amphiplicatus sp.]